MMALEKSLGKPKEQTQPQRSQMRPPLPRRDAFERQLSELNYRIGELEEEKRKIRGLGEDRGALQGLKDQIHEKKKDRETHRKISRELEPGLGEVRTKLEDTKKAIQKIEMDQDWMMRNESTLQFRLTKMTQDFSSRNFSLKEESRYVKEIDKIKRAIRLAKTHAQLLEERKVVEAKFRELNDTHKKSQTTYKKSAWREKNLRHDLERLKSRDKSIWLDLKNCQKERTELIQQYQCERSTYETWKKENRIVRPSGTRPNPNRKDRRGSWNKFGRKGSNVGRTDSDSDSDDEELEPFYTEKNNCRALLEYLQGLLNQVDKDLVQEMTAMIGDGALAHTMLGDQGSSIDSDAASSVKQSSKGDSTGWLAPQSPKSKKRSGRRRKPTHNITHDAMKVALFEQLHLPIPTTFQDIPASISSAVDLQNFYEGQTFIPPAESPVEDESMLNFAYPSSGSEMTVDSALTTSMSEAASFASFNHSISMPDEMMTTSQSCGLLGQLSSPERTKRLPTLFSAPERLTEIGLNDETTMKTVDSKVEFERPPLTSSPTLTAGPSFEFARSLSDGGDSVNIVQSLERSDGVTTPKPPASIEGDVVGAILEAEIARDSARLVRAPTDEGIAGIGDHSKDSSVNSTAQQAEIAALRRQFENKDSVSDPIGMQRSSGETERESESVDLREMNAKVSDRGSPTEQDDVVVTRF